MSKIIQKIRKYLLYLRLYKKNIFVDGLLPDAEKAKQILEGCYPVSNNSCFSQDNLATESSIDLSIIVPAYNVEQYVEACIDSILSQTTSFSYEIILIDDGSTDDTYRIIDDKYRNIDNVSILSHENKGLSGTRNVGLGLSGGKYVMFVDSDDQLLPGAIENLMQMAVKNDAKLVVGGFVYKLSNGKVKDGVCFKDGKSSPYELNYGMPWGKVIRRDIFINLRFPEGYWFEDSIMACIVWPMCEDSCYTVSSPVYEYLINTNGISHLASRSNKSLDSLRIVEQLFRDKFLFGLELSQKDYEYFLKMVRLTYRRTCNLSNDVRKSIFVMQQEIRKELFGGKKSTINANIKIENDLEKSAYKKYCLHSSLY